MEAKPNPPRRCDGCKYWSYLLAQAIGTKPTKAMCLHPDRKQEYVHLGCTQHVAGLPVDML